MKSVEATLLCIDCPNLQFGPRPGPGPGLELELGPRCASAESLNAWLHRLTFWRGSDAAQVDDDADDDVVDGDDDNGEDAAAADAAAAAEEDGEASVVAGLTLKKAAQTTVESQSAR